MSKLACVICICLITLPVICQPAPKYEIATITDVKLHQPTGVSASGVLRYDVSINVAGKVYVVLYTDTLGTGTVKYAAGRELLVHVGQNTITYNDILGRSLDVPILSRRPDPNGKQSK